MADGGGEQQDGSWGAAECVGWLRCCSKQQQLLLQVICRGRRQRRCKCIRKAQLLQRLSPQPLP